MGLRVFVVIALMALAENIAHVQERITAAALRSGRKTQEIVLMAVTKTFPSEQIRAAYDAGLRIFGENRVQEFAGKGESLRDLHDAEWHMIGHVQSNKATKAVEIFANVDSLDSVRLARKLNAATSEMGKRLPVLIEVNIGGEEAKNGVAPDSAELQDLLVAAPELPSLEKIRSSLGPISAKCVSCSLKSTAESCPRFAWTCFPWACPMISRLRSKKAQLVCAWEQRSLARDRRLGA